MTASSAQGAEGSDDIDRVSVTDSIFHRLRTEILLGKFAPGDRLPSERVLGATLKSNRGAVREALKRLQQARLVAIHERGGTEVLDFRKTAGLEIIPELLDLNEGRIDPLVARSMIELRSLITPDLVRLAVKRDEGRLHSELRCIVDRMKANLDDLDVLQDLTDEFWDLLARCSGNVAYQLVFNTIRDFRRRGRKWLNPALAHRYRELGTLDEIVAAAGAGDAAAAQHAAQRQSDVISKTLKEANPLLTESAPTRT